MLNKLGYIELYISKTRIHVYRSFSEVPLPFKSMLITFHISNSSISLEYSKFRDQHTKINWQQFLDRHIPFIYRTLRTQWKQSKFHSFALERRRHCFYYSNSFIIEENNDCILLHSVINIMQTNKFGLLFTAFSISCKQTRCKNRNIMLLKWLRWIE